MPDWKNVTKDLLSAQQVEHDNRERVREAQHFISKKDGQWEPHVAQQYTGRPRYTFDRCRIVVDDIMGQIEQSDFAITVYPTGGQATKDVAIVRNGIIRKNERLSGARYIYNQAARKMVATGIAGWRVVQKWADSKSFDQDLMIQRVSNFEDRVWYDPGAREPDMSDADYCYVLTEMSLADYKKQFPTGSGLSIGKDNSVDVYEYKMEDTVIVGEYLWKKQEKTGLVLMSNGAVYEATPEFTKVRDELQAAGITVQREREAKIDVVHQRIFDGSDWLTNEQKTVFQWLPVIPVYGNFDISEGKVIYEGVVEPLMDAQRVLNYAESRKIEEGALAPREKLMMTKEQAAGHEQQLKELNTSPDPVLFYNHRDGQPAPFKIAGPNVNPALAETANAMNFHIQQTAGTFQAQRQKAVGVQSGEAIERLENKENNSNYKYFQAMEVAITHTARVFNDALPKVYDTQRQINILNADGSEKKVQLNNTVTDQQTGEVVTLNDLSTGIYDVSCSVGPAFQNQQEQTVDLLIQAAKVDPSIMEVGGDVFLNNFNSASIENIAERKRALLVKQGVIPVDQLTDDEKAQLGLTPLEQMNNQQLSAMVVQLMNQVKQQPDAMVIAAQAEVQKAEADLQEAQVKAAQLQLQNGKLQLEAQKESFSAQKEREQLNLERQKLALQAKKEEDDSQARMNDQILQTVQVQSDELKKQAETLKILREAMGADAIVSPNMVELVRNQTDIVEETQDAQGEESQTT